MSAVPKLEGGTEPQERVRIDHDVEDDGSPPATTASWQHTSPSRRQAFPSAAASCASACGGCCQLRIRVWRGAVRQRHGASATARWTWSPAAGVRAALPAQPRLCSFLEQAGAQVQPAPEAAEQRPGRLRVGGRGDTPMGKPNMARLHLKAPNSLHPLLDHTPCAPSPHTLCPINTHPVPHHQTPCAPSPHTLCPITIHPVPHHHTPCAPSPHTLCPITTHPVPHQHNTLCPITKHHVPYRQTPCALSPHTLCPITTHPVPHHHTPCAPSPHTLCPITKHPVPHQHTPCAPSTHTLCPIPEQLLLLLLLQQQQKKNRRPKAQQPCQAGGHKQTKQPGGFARDILPVRAVGLW